MHFKGAFKCILEEFWYFLNFCILICVFKIWEVLKMVVCFQIKCVYENHIESA